MTMYASRPQSAAQTNAPNEILDAVRTCPEHSEGLHAHRKECVAEELTYFSSKYKRLRGLASDEDHANRVLTRWMAVFG